MFTWQPKGGGGGCKPYCLRLSLRQSAIGMILCGSGHNDGVFLCTLNFYLAAQGGGGLNPLTPPPPLRSATAFRNRLQDYTSDNFVYAIVVQLYHLLIVSKF